jgi:hypothetical protein
MGPDGKGLLGVRQQFLQLLSSPARKAPAIMTHASLLLKAEPHVQALAAFLDRADHDGLRLDQVERGLFEILLQAGHDGLVAFVEQAGDGDVGPEATAPDGQVCRRLPEPHARTYRSIFGPLTITRCVYGTREGQAIRHVPLDAQLGLPAGEFSYVLEDWSQRLCLQGAFAEAARSLHDLLGLRPSVRSLEGLNRVVAEVAADFTAGRPVPPPEQEGELLVLTADGKGVPMRRPVADQPRRHPRRRKGEKANQKQMACVGAIYTIDRFVRTPDQVVDEVQRRDRAKDRPAPQHKHVWAEMTQVVEGEELNGRVNLFAHLAEERQRRDPAGAKTTVCLLDGERALWDAWDEFWPDTVGILDLFHVLERLWDAAYCFHAEGSAAAEQFVTARLRLLLTGKARRLITGLRRLGTKHGLKGAKAQKLKTVIGYLKNNRDHLNYDEYLAAGYPIGSGVAEGACRHLVKDRLEQTGMRWTRDGAQAMLHLRATYLNGDWEAFQTHRIDREQRDLYGARAAEPHYTLAG